MNAWQANDAKIRRVRESIGNLDLAAGQPIDLPAASVTSLALTIAPL